MHYWREGRLGAIWMGIHHGCCWALEWVEQGWWYGLPNPGGGVFLGYCARAARRSDARAPAAARFERELERTRLMRSLTSVNGAAIRVRGSKAGTVRFDAVLGPGWIAVGDAAFAADPLSGLGCDFAIASGLEAAAALLCGGREAMARYEEMARQFIEIHERQRSRHYAAPSPPSS